MSVLVKDRYESNIQYIDTARELLEFAITHCVRFPKRYKEYLSLPIVNYCREVYTKVKTANSIYATIPTELEQRITLLNEALGLLYSLITLVDVVHTANIREIEEYGGKQEIKDSTWKGFAELIDKEINLIKKVLKSDKKVYSNL